MKVFPAILLLSLAIVGANCQCQDSDQDVLESLYAAFGTESQPNIWGCQVYLPEGINCQGLSPPIYNSWAYYRGNPRSLQVSSYYNVYLNGAPQPPPSSQYSYQFGPWSETIDFSSNSCLDSVDDILSEIRSFNPTPPGLPNTPPPIPPQLWTPAPNPQPPTPFPTAVDKFTVFPSHADFFPTTPLNGDECSNTVNDITYRNSNGKKITTTCEDVATSSNMRMNRLCKNVPAIDEQCPGICKTKDQCMCENNPWEFQLRRKKTLSCSSLEVLPGKVRKRKCKKKRIKKQCPRICKEECSVSSNSAKLVI